LGVTVGTWIVSYFAVVHGGLWERAAAYTPSSMVAEFQHGLIRLEVLLAASVLILTGLTLCAVWTRLGIATHRRVGESLAVMFAAAVLLVGCTLFTASWDTSEARSNSFSRPDEALLAHIRGPLRVVVHLAPEDPRRVDLERRALSKLRRVMPDARIEYIASTSTGMFEQTREHYGEIWYELQGRPAAVSRATTAEGVLESIYEVAGLTPPAQTEADVFRGHPLAAPPKWAASIFYGFWPAATIGAAILTRWRTT
jgi:hypothetical protein